MTADLATLAIDLAARRLRVAVIGDHLLDRWWSGSAGRLAREAPAPVVDLEERVSSPGGAANTAVNLAALGAEVRAVGLVGDDDAGRELIAALAAAGVDTRGLITVAGARTPTKTRISAGGQVLARLDEPGPAAWPDESVAALTRAVSDATADADAELVCDYTGRGLTDALRDALAARAERPSLTVVDAHDLARWRPLAPDLVTPNALEAQAVAGLDLTGAADRPALVAASAGRILAATGARLAAVTLDTDGAVLVAEGTPEALRSRAEPSAERDASGAGDTFCAALSLALAGGIPTTDALAFAQAAATVAVGSAGTCVCSTAELVAAHSRRNAAHLDARELAAAVAGHRARGERIVFTNGCFDVLHRGHTAYLGEARGLGDVLVVAINGDESVTRLKGPGRPINVADDRATVLAALACVDYVTVFDEDTPSALIAALEPDVYAKGGDYTPGMLAETAVVEEHGGRVAILGYVPDRSTSGIVDRIRRADPHGEPA